MLLRPARITLNCGVGTDEVVERLRAAGAAWRESKFSPTARAAGILGWRVRTRESRIVIRARIGGRNPWLPHFVGRLHPTSGGSFLVGELRPSWFPRVFTLIWLSCAGGAPIIALFGPLPNAGVGEHILAALVILVPAMALFSAGLWLVRRSWTPPAAAFRELLEGVCVTRETVASNPTGDASHVG